MTEHDPRCEGANDQKLLDDVAEYGWHVIKVLDQPDTPGWAYSVGLFQNFKHPEIIVFGLESEVEELWNDLIHVEYKDGGYENTRQVIRYLGGLSDHKRSVFLDELVSIGVNKNDG